MRVLLTTLNAKYIHKNLAIRWLYVAADKQHQTFLHEFTIKDSLQHIAEQIGEYNVDVIGISTYIWNGEYVKKLVPLIKEKQPDCRIVLGGPEVTYQYNDYLSEYVDGILLGEGEKTFWQYVNEEENIPGLITHNYKNEEVVKTDVNWLETLPSPYLLDFDLPDMGKRYLYIEAGRGCPYQCGYCMASLDNKLRNFSLDYVMNLIDQLEKTDVKQIKFLDRTFNSDKNRSYMIAKRLLEYKKGTSFQFEVMADTLSDELIELVNNNPDKDKFRFEVGIQSFNKETLKEVRRYQNLDKLCTNVTSLVEHGAIVHADLIGGLPLEDLASFKDTYSKLFALKTDEMQVGILKLLKGSRLRNEMDKYGIICQQQTPYQIIKNDWVSEEDVESIVDCAAATERLWNRNLIRETLWYLYSNGVEMFDFMEKLGKLIGQLPRPFQPHQLFALIDGCIEDETGKLLLLNEYYKQFTQRPVRYKECDIEKKQKSIIFETICANTALTNNDIRYAFFDYGIFNNQKVYQVLIYNSDSKLPDRYFVSLDNEYLGGENLNERHHDCYGK